MTNIRLPDAEHQYPTCGTCSGETWHDGDTFICDDCQLAFDSNTLEASFLDSDAKACGKPCDNPWHRPGRIQPGVEYDCNPCQLPDAHKSLCWTGCRPRRTEK